MPGATDTILILGGTLQAAAIAERLCNDTPARVITSLAGRTQNPLPVAGETRTGGFGGAAGLATYLRAHNVDLVIDATHPFAQTISGNAAWAAEQTGVRLMRLCRPAWEPDTQDRWLRVASLEAARDAIPSSSRTFLALGRQHIDLFACRDDVHFILRMVDAPADDLPFRSYEVIVGKPSPDVDAETDLLTGCGASHIVCRNSGGTGAFAKILAARQCGLPVIMIDRPAEAGGPSFASVSALLAAVI